MAIYTLPPSVASTWERRLDVKNPGGSIGNFGLTPAIVEAEVTGDNITSIELHDVSLNGKLLKTHVIFSKSRPIPEPVPAQVPEKEIEIPDTPE